MLRLVAFFVLALMLASVLGHVPLVGPFFRHTGVFGVLLAAAVLSAVLTRVGARVWVTRKMRGELRLLAQVGNARNHGKMGALLLARGHARESLAHLEEATRGEPEVAEWHYRLGLARLASADPAGALAALERCVALEEEHAYGAAQMRRAEALQRLRRADEALAVLCLLERNHGPSPESAFRRGRARRALGQRAEARAAFAEVNALARAATRYQRRSAGWWALRAQLARLV